jgi:plastocyanin
MPRWVKITALVAGVLVLGLVAVLIFGGGEHGPGQHLGSDGSDHGGNHAPSDGTNRHGAGHTPPSNGTRGAVTWTIEVTDNTFAPTELTIQAGDTVEWIHVGSNGHTITAGDESFDSHPDCNSIVDAALGNCMDEDETYTQTFDEIGEVAYHCKLHDESGMTATIEVRQEYNGTREGRHH